MPLHSAKDVQKSTAIEPIVVNHLGYGHVVYVVTNLQLLDAMV